MTTSQSSQHAKKFNATWQCTIKKATTAPLVNVVQEDTRLTRYSSFQDDDEDLMFLSPHDVIRQEGLPSHLGTMVMYPVGSIGRLNALVYLAGLRSTCHVRVPPSRVAEGGPWVDAFVSISTAKHIDRLAVSASTAPCYPVAAVCVHVLKDGGRDSHEYTEYRLAFHQLLKCLKHGSIRSLTHTNVLPSLSTLEVLVLDECMAHELAFIASQP
jgi:hypothetical protein